jgi:hypothetical protein
MGSPNMSRTSRPEAIATVFDVDPAMSEVDKKALMMDLQGCRRKWCCLRWLPWWGRLSLPQSELVQGSTWAGRNDRLAGDAAISKTKWLSIASMKHVGLDNYPRKRSVNTNGIRYFQTSTISTITNIIKTCTCVDLQASHYWTYFEVFPLFCPPISLPRQLGASYTTAQYEPGPDTNNGCFTQQLMDNEKVMSDANFPSGRRERQYKGLPERAAC